jgi:hypothetical protein
MTSAYTNTTTQAERAETLQNDKAVQRANTFAGRAIAEADDVRGRWAEINKSNVVGATPTVQYPMAAPNWSVDPTGIEPPLNIDVNAVEPCGEKFEIEALGDATEAVAQSASPLAAVAAPSEVHASPADVERTAANPIPTTRRKP